MTHPADPDLAVSPPDPPSPILSQWSPFLEQALTSLSLWVAQQQQGMADLVASHGVRDQPVDRDGLEAMLDRPSDTQPAQSRVVDDDARDFNKVWR